MELAGDVSAGGRVAWVDRCRLPRGMPARAALAGSPTAHRRVVRIVAGFDEYPALFVVHFPPHDL